MTWNDWAVWFADAFALGEWHARSVKVWIADVFVPGGATPQEIKEAALMVLRSGPPARPHEILKAIVDELRRNRAAEVLDHDDAQRRGEAESSGCPWCGGTGWAVVPQHPQPPAPRKRPKRPGEEDDDTPPPLATCAVACSCGAGLALRPMDHREQPAMTLTQYTARNPDWVRQLERERKRVRSAGSEWVSCKALVARVSEYLRHDRDY